MNTVLIRRANVELEVNEALLPKYLLQGYNQVDNKGNIVNRGVPNNYTDLKKAYDEILVENKSLKEQVEKLNAQLKKAKSKPKEDK